MWSSRGSRRDRLRLNSKEDVSWKNHRFTQILWSYLSDTATPKVWKMGCQSATSNLTLKVELDGRVTQYMAVVRWRVAIFHLRWRTHPHNKYGQFSILTFTPLMGMSTVVEKFLKNPSKAQSSQHDYLWCWTLHRGRERTDCCFISWTWKRGSCRGIQQWVAVEFTKYLKKFY